MDRLEEERSSVYPDFTDDVAEPDAITKMLGEVGLLRFFPDVLVQGLNDHRHHECHARLISQEVLLDMLDAVVET